MKANYESLFANVNGVRIHYLKSHSGKTPLVLVHGFGDDARMWLPLFADFGRDYTIIAPDLVVWASRRQKKPAMTRRLQQLIFMNSSGASGTRISISSATISG